MRKLATREPRSAGRAASSEPERKPPGRGTETPIPGGGRPPRIEHVVFDFDGTLAVDGRLIRGVAPRLGSLAARTDVVVMGVGQQRRMRERFSTRRGTSDIDPETGEEVERDVAPSPDVADSAAAQTPPVV